MPSDAAARWLPLLTDIADTADQIALRYFRAPSLTVDAKSDASPVTIADRSIEAAARELVEQRSPGLGIYGEEYGETTRRGETRLIIDPIDGTRNFVRGIPIFATLLAVEERGEVVAGLVSAPALGTRWHAARGAGAFSGTRRLRVSSIHQLRDAQLFHADLSGCSETAPPPGLLALFRHAQRTRGFGDFYQHVLVAEGAGEFAIDSSVKPWDVAALQILVEEAGGRCSTLDARRDIYGGTLVSTNGVLHDRTLAILLGGAG